MILIFYKISFFLGGIVPLLLGLFIYIKNKKEIINKTYLGLSLCCAIWSFGFFAMISSITLKTAYFWRWFMEGGSILTPALWLHFIYAFLNINKEKKKEIIFVYACSFFLWFLNFIDLFISGIFTREMTRKYIFNFYPTAGFGYYMYFIFFFSVVIYSLIQLFEKYKKNNSLQNRQIIYLLIASIAGFGGGGMTFFLTLGIPIAPYGVFFFVFYPVIIAYAITKHHLFDIKVITTEFFVSALSIVTFTKIIVAENAQEQIINGMLFISTTTVGILLIRSVIKEVRQREAITQMAEDVKRAYVIEKRAKEELEQLDKVKDQFLLTAQHNLRTPLTSIMGYSDLMLNGTFGKQNKKTTEVIGKLQILAQGMIKMVNNFLDMAQFQLGKGVVNLKSGVEIAPILGEVVEELRFKAESKGISLNLDASEPVSAVSADREKLKAALFNIIDNAVKYTNRGSVVVKIKNQNAKIKIIVEDTGIGIPKDKLPSLFEAQFERSEAAKKAASVGSGVGLYLAGQIIKAHNGRVWAESPARHSIGEGGEGEDKGTAFFVELPTG